MSRSGWVTLLVLFVVLVLVFFYYLQVQKNNQAERLDSSPVAVSLGGEAKYTDIDGNPVELSDYVGQKVIVFAWASWCPACVEQLTLLSGVASQHDDVVVLAINRAEPIPTAVSFLEFYKLDTSVQLVMDPTDHFFSSVNGFSMPESVVFDSSGSISHHERGPITREEIEYIILGLD